MLWRRDNPMLRSSPLPWRISAGDFISVHKGHDPCHAVPGRGHDVAPSFSGTNGETCSNDGTSYASRQLTFSLPYVVKLGDLELCDKGGAPDLSVVLLRL